MIKILSNKNYFIKRRSLVILIIITELISLVIHYTILPPKYFCDSNNYLKLVNDLFRKDTGNIIVEFYRTIDIFGINTLFGWSIFTGLFVNTTFYLYVRNKKLYTISELIFYFSLLGIINIFACCITKEIIQLMFFLIIDLINKSPFIKSDTIKVILISLILYYCSKVFREYYIIVAFFTVVVYFILNKFRNSKVQKNKYGTTIKIFLCVIVSLIIFLLAASKITPIKYNQILTMHWSYITEGFYSMTDSAIKDLIYNRNNLILYLINYLINTCRLLIPIELISGKAYYLLFVVFQLMLTCKFIKLLLNIKEINKKSLISLAVFYAFVICSVLFEPDFGSWVRHESITFPLFLNFCLKNEKILKS